MRRISFAAILGVSVVLGCGDDGPAVVPSPSTYQIIPPVTEVRVGQDSLIALYNFGVRVVRDGTDTIPGTDTLTQRLPRLSYFLEDVSIAYIDYNSGGEAGRIRGIKPGTTNLRITGYGQEISFPITVTARPPSAVILRVLSGPKGGRIAVASRTDTGTFYALPTHRTTSRLEGLILGGPTGTDTLFCNYCTIKAAPNGRVQRTVRFYSLDPAKAIVSNAANPTSQRLEGNTPINTDTVGYVTVFDTSSTPVGIVMEVPGDGLADTVYLKFKLRPIDTLRVMPDSLDVPATDVDDIGTDRIQYPGGELLGIATQSGNTNYVVRAEFRSFVALIPLSPTGAAIAETTVVNIRSSGAVTVFRRNVPIITWESALESYLQINAAGNIVAPCAFITDAGCLAPVRSGNAATQAARDSLVIKCVDNGKRLPGVMTNGNPVGPAIAFGGDGVLSLPTCPLVGALPGPNIPMPGAYCTSALSTDLSATCSIWIRARATDQASGKALVDRFRVEVRR